MPYINSNYVNLEIKKLIYKLNLNHIKYDKLIIN